MKNWQADLIEAHVGTSCEQELFRQIVATAKTMGFEFCAYGVQIPTSISNPKIVLRNNYPGNWQARYLSEEYLSLDPTIQHARISRRPVVWTEELFSPSARTLWEDAQAAGLRVGWAQSSINSTGVLGMLTLSRSSEVLTSTELAALELRMSWLVNVSHYGLSKILMKNVVDKLRSELTAREIEILKWSADGKTSSEISSILSISENTVNFHIKNVIVKMQTANKTAAVVRASMLGLLS